MELTIAVVALIVLTLVYAVASIRSRAAMNAAKRERTSLYRSCFLKGLAGILAKMANADGSVSLDEVTVVGRLFNDMGLDAEDRDLCFEAFKTAKDSTTPMSYYTGLFAPYSTEESRILVYELLWDLAAADGRFDIKEEQFLRDLVGQLKLDEGVYLANLNRCSGLFCEQDVRIKQAERKLEKVLAH